MNSMTSDNTTQDLAMLVRRLVRAFSKTGQEQELCAQAIDYLCRHGLEGSPLREPAAAPGEVSDERASFETWARTLFKVPSFNTLSNIYSGAHIESMWMTWQARAALSNPAPVAAPAPCKECGASILLSITPFLKVSGTTEAIEEVGRRMKAAPAHPPRVTLADIENQTKVLAGIEESDKRLKAIREDLVQPLKDHQIAKLVNDLRDVAKKFHDHQSLRERIARLVRPIAKGEPVQPEEAEGEAEAFEQLCREHDIAGTAAARQCEVFWHAGVVFAARRPRGGPDKDTVDRIIGEHIHKISGLGEGHPVEKLNYYRDLVRAGFDLAGRQ
jgi:hypothetical protein